MTLISAQYRVGEADEARQHADTLIERMQLQIDDGAGRAWWTNFYESCSWAAMGENDRALDKLEVIVESPGLVWYPVLRDALCFQELTDHPRYQAVVAAIDARMRAIRERLPATLARHGVI